MVIKGREREREREREGEKFAKENKRRENHFK
jgi:hypothetical protein